MGPAPVGARERRGKAGSTMVSGKHRLVKTMMPESVSIGLKPHPLGFFLYKQPNKENHLAWVQ